MIILICECHDFRCQEQLKIDMELYARLARNGYLVSKDCKTESEYKVVEDHPTFTLVRRKLS